MVLLFPQVTCREGMRDRYIREFDAIAPQVRQEPGCIEYNIYIDSGDDRFDNQKRSDTVFLCEKWESVDALQAHSKNSEPLAAFRETVRPIKISSTYELITPAGTEYHR